MASYLTLTKPNGRLVRIVKAQIVSWSEDDIDRSQTHIVTLSGFQNVKESVAVVMLEYDKTPD